MLPFVFFGVLLVVGLIGLVCLLHQQRSGSPWVPYLMILGMAGFLGTVVCGATASNAASELEKATARGRELRELSANLDVIKDPLVKANTVVEAYLWNKKLDEAKAGNASQWSDIFWADGWAALTPIEIR